MCVSVFFYFNFVSSLLNIKKYSRSKCSTNESRIVIIVVLRLVVVVVAVMIAVLPVVVVVAQFCRWCYFQLLQVGLLAAVVINAQPVVGIGTVAVLVVLVLLLVPVVLIAYLLALKVLFIYLFYYISFLINAGGGEHLVSY